MATPRLQKLTYISANLHRYIDTFFSLLFTYIFIHTYVLLFYLRAYIYFPKKNSQLAYKNILANVSQQKLLFFCCFSQA